jgi:signal transduction histidine kinase
MSRLGIRARLLAAAVSSVIVALCVLVVVFNVVLGRRLASDTDSLLRARANAELSAVRIRHGTPVIAESPDAAATTSPVWVFAGRTPIESPRAPAAIDRRAHLMARQPVGLRDVTGEETRLLSVALLDHARRVGTVVAAVSLDPYNDARATALLASVVLALVLALVFTVSTGWILRRALQPVSRMTADAADWSEHDVDRRFQLGPPNDELTQLGATLDDLLGRLAAGLRREQRLSAEISHELRTPLARIQAESDLALRRERTSAEYTSALTSISDNAQRMTEIIDTLMETARQEASPATATCDMLLAAQAAVAGCLPVATAQSVEVELTPSLVPARARVEQALAERILQPLLENACRHARTRVTVTVATVESDVRVTVLDDGPGIAAAEAERVFEPGARGVESGGAGLGLALARRLARAGNGDVVAHGGGAGGELVVTLPSASPPARRRDHSRVRVG